MAQQSKAPAVETSILINIIITASSFLRIARGDVVCVRLHQ
jgi:hypothetical protein